MKIPFIATVVFFLLLTGCSNLRPINEWSHGVDGVIRYDPVCASRGIELAKEATRICEIAFQIGDSFRYKSDCLHKYDEVQRFIRFNKTCGLDTEDAREWQASWRRLDTIYKKCDIPKNLM